MNNNETPNNIVPFDATATSTEVTKPAQPLVEIDESRLKKKVYMLIGVTDAFCQLPKISTELEIVSAREIINASKKNFEEGNFQEADLKANRCLDKLEECCDLLPKVARGLVRTQLKKIAKY